jgi:hypothetical protein
MHTENINIRRMRFTWVSSRCRGCLAISVVNGAQAAPSGHISYAACSGRCFHLVLGYFAVIVNSTAANAGMDVRPAATVDRPDRRQCVGVETN